MANRNIRQLLNLALVDYRFYMGTIRDFSGNGNDLVWTAGREPEFVRTIGGVVGLDYRGTGAAGPILVSSAAFELNGSFTWEILFLMRSRGEGGFGHLMTHETGATKRMYIGNINQITFDCGVGFGAFGVPENEPVHWIATREGETNGTMYDDGSSISTGNAGNKDSTSVLRIGNRSLLDRALDGIIYSVRVLSDEISADEAARLYEHSRIQLWPGAPKRSGIMSPVV